jgi:hypothetical protein
VSSVLCRLFSEKKLPPAGAGYDFPQYGVDFFQQVASLHAIWKRLSVMTLQAGALDEIADFKIVLII